MAAFIELRGVTKRFDGLTAVDDVSLSLVPGEVFSLLGPSGCGKTTLLRMLAGFVEPDAGTIIVDGVDITRAPPNRRPINTVFQNYALFPHLTVRDNIAFGLRVARRPRREIDAAVDAMLDLTQLHAHAHKRPGAISGGQKQRVAIARALINRPRLLLLDEPLAALDLKLRQRMLLELDRIHDEVGITFLYVTHDQGEAMSLSDRLAVMDSGRIEQIGNPAEIYEAPRTRFVADFIGDTNIIDGTVASLDGESYLRLDLGDLGTVLAWKDRDLRPGDPVHLSVRPEKISIARQPPEGNGIRNQVRGRVEDVIYLGSQTRYRVRVGGQLIIVLQQHNRYLLDLKPIRWEETVWLGWHADDGCLIQGA
jgi:spermidine/putrescine transport system ATP-binding protein